jgi:glycosyltransferase involved in cell wall biosynthesis
VRVSYLYNEILPTRTAHDAYVFGNCASLAGRGVAVELVCGRGSWPVAELERHYQWSSSGVTLSTLPMLRRNVLGVTWNLVFFVACQRHLARERPDWVALSVLRQGAYHLRRRIPGVRYVYEVHELGWYPALPRDGRGDRRVALERDLLARADLVTVTTEALRDILTTPPYSIVAPVHVVPLGVGQTPLPAPNRGGTLRAVYIGQLYGGQGVERLLAALAQTRDVELTVVGGKPEEVARLKAHPHTLRLRERVRFLGYRPPSALAGLAGDADVFVAPFEPVGRMPYVAHTKLLEYAAWGRPVIAPDLPVVREHFPGRAGWVGFEPGNTASLAAALQRVQRDPALLQDLHIAISQQRPPSWQERATRYESVLRSA